MGTVLRCSFEVHQATEEWIYLVDRNTGDRTLTNDAPAVIEHLAKTMDLRNRRVYYRATDGRIDELWHEDGRFRGYAPQDQHAIKVKLGI